MCIRDRAWDGELTQLAAMAMRAKLDLLSPLAFEAQVPDSFVQPQLAHDPVAHPSHYTAGEIECIDAIRAALGPEQFKGYLRGNIIKYLWRGPLKNGAEDYEKAQWYLARLIEEERGEEQETTVEYAVGRLDGADVVLLPEPHEMNGVRQ